MSLFRWMKFARVGYETAQYQVVESDGPFEIRDYPELTLATTEAKFEQQGRDGSFMKLFGYISGANQDRAKIAMTTPVLMGKQSEGSMTQMGFVLPKEVADVGAPIPCGAQVEIRKRPAGRFAIIRFSGNLNLQSAQEHETKLRSWMSTKGLRADESGSPSVETAGYDPPFTPGALRRKKVLIRLGDSN
ncbi:MAG: SOUL family heme-binding protein [Pirellula sp.]